MEAERKLELYRKQKNRQNYMNRVLHNIQSYFTFPTVRQRMNINEVDKPIDTKKESLIIEDETVSDTEDDEINCTPSYITIVTYVLYFVLWFTVYLIFIKLQFGIVYLITSALVGIYFNTRTSRRRANEVSAYSVFNKNCESIDGTLKAEQFEREIRFGSASVR
ncbi:hypothetical protein FQA39_LY08422 [Lamprigera yunnana]|nr:hypothetical protein FQA39_LY08422 [Lamprigera yunnana]